MGVLNVTPDSFSDGGKFYKTKVAVQHAKTMLQQGAHIIDVGGESTRPGAKLISEEEECRRVIQVIKKIKKIRNNIVSIDTRKSLVMKAAVVAGVLIKYPGPDVQDVKDVRAGGPGTAQTERQ